MPAKQILKPQQQFQLRAALQTAALAALMDSRRWEPGDLAFQGGTCLHLAHGSMRFSEDLDFMVRGGLSLDGLAKEVQRRLQLPPNTPAGLSVSVAPSRTERNPHAFTLTLSGPNFIGSAKVKIELWQTDAAVLKTLQLVVKPLATPSGTQTYVPSITLEEILSDKVYALGARERLKPRDIHDLWWLQQQGPLSPTLNPTGLVSRLAIYPQGSGTETAQKWLLNAAQRMADLQKDSTPVLVTADLQRWLPSAWGMDAARARTMLQVAQLQLKAGITVMQAFVA